MTDDVWFELLGPIRVRQAGVEVVLGPPRQRAVLAVLLLSSGRPVRTERIIDLVWGADAPGQSVNLVQKYVSGLRRALRGLATLSWTDAGYVLDPAGRIDLERFEELVSAGRRHRAAGDTAGAAESLAEALSLCRGPLAEGMDGLGIEPDRIRLAEARLSAAEELFELDLELGRLVSRIPELRRLAAEHPLRERLQAQLILALSASGRQAEALAAFDDIRRLLVEEYGLDPGPHLREAQQRVLRAEQEMADRTVPDRVTGGPLSAPLPTPAQLPYDLRGFAGREEQIGRVAELLRPVGGAIPVVCLEGTAGVGKTALAVHCAHRAAELFPDGQLFADLHGHDRQAPADPAETLGRFLRALGVADKHVPQGLDDRIGLYRSLLASRSVLVVLDNAVDADQLRPLLPGSGRCGVLVTSRRRLVSLSVREGAHRLVVPVLTVGESRELMRAVLGDSRVDEDPVAADEIVRLCAGLPLALRIVASNVACRPGVPLSEVARGLAGGNRVAKISSPDEERTALASSIGLSYESLAAPARNLLLLLGLVPGPDVTAEAASTLAGTTGPEAAELLSALVTANLVERVDADRYRFQHALLQIFARDRAQRELTEEERGLALRRLFGWYLMTAATTSRHWARYNKVDMHGVVTPDPHTSPEARRALLAAEFPNLVAAIKYAAESGPYPLAWQLAESLRGFCKQHALLQEWCAVAQAGLAATRLAGDRRAEATMLLNLSDASHNAGLIAEGEDYARQAMAVGPGDGRLSVRAAALDQLGRAGWVRGELASARVQLTEAAEIHTQLADPLGVALALNALGRVELDSGDAEAAQRHYTLCLRLARTTGAVAIETTTLIELGLVHRALNRPHSAALSLGAALALSRAGAHPRSEALALSYLSALHAERGRVAEAAEAAREGLRVVELHRDRWTEAECLNATGTAALAAGDAATALVRFRGALSTAGALGYRRGELHALAGLGAATLRAGHPEDALRYAQQAMTAAAELGYRDVVAAAALTGAEARTRPAEPARRVPGEDQNLDDVALGRWELLTGVPGAAGSG